ncbi:enoyl- hydratase isomerase family protein, partial [Cystoisospora suis]
FYSLEEWEEVIDDHFRANSLSEVKERLRASATSSHVDSFPLREGSGARRKGATLSSSSLTSRIISSWAQAVLDRLSQRSSIAAEV